MEVLRSAQNGEDGGGRERGIGTQHRNLGARGAPSPQSHRTSIGDPVYGHKFTAQAPLGTNSAGGGSRHWLKGLRFGGEGGSPKTRVAFPPPRGAHCRQRTRCVPPLGDVVGSAIGGSRLRRRGARGRAGKGRWSSPSMRGKHGMRPPSSKATSSGHQGESLTCWGGEGWGGAPTGGGAETDDREVWNRPSRRRLSFFLGPWAFDLDDGPSRARSFSIRTFTPDRRRLFKVVPKS